MSVSEINSLAELKAQGYAYESVRDEMRRNLMSAISEGRERFPGIVGYDRTVLPSLENAILARHDILLLGLRGQAKTRLLRSLTSLLDEKIPVIAGCPINDAPGRPSCARCRKLAESRDDYEIEWIPRDRRYREKLATPDVTVADLIGDIDPIKAANLRLDYSNEEVIHYGIIPRTNRGIFAINEVPDLSPRIQVALLNILEERDLQIRGFPMRLPLDVVLVFSANPEDYTSRGNIITPLKDRIDSQILTHYPTTMEIARSITAQEAWVDRQNDGVVLSEDALNLIEQIAFSARESDLVDHSSGVSARLPISAVELLSSNLERRKLMTGEERVYPRLADFMSLFPAMTGKVELVYEGEQQGPEMVARSLLSAAVLVMFANIYGEIPRGRMRARPDIEEPEIPQGGPYSEIVEWFVSGNSITISDQTPFSEHLEQLQRVPGLEEIAKSKVEDRTMEETAFSMELLLEGLHQSLLIGREDHDSSITFAEAMRYNILRTVK